MDWSNENYVRIYTRDTADLMAIGPEGRAVWWEILRKADMSGVIDHGGDLETLPELLRVPYEWFEKAMPRILKRGMCIDNGSAIVIPNHDAAQTTPKSDKLRQKEARQKRKSHALSMSQNVTNESRNVTEESQAVTNRDEIVTNGHTASRDVTLRYATQRNATLRSTSSSPPHPRRGKDSKSGQPVRASRQPSAQPDQLQAPEAPSARPAQKVSPEALQLAQDLAHAIAARQPGSRPARDPEECARQWSVHLDRLHRLDKRPWSIIRQVMDWSQRDSFWQDNILSGKKLREQFDKLEARQKKEMGQPVRASSSSPQSGGMSAEELWNWNEEHPDDETRNGPDTGHSQG